MLTLRYLFFIIACTQLTHAKAYNIATVFHLYDLPLMNDCLDRINGFIEKNNTHNHHIYINIPIAKNIDAITTNFPHVSAKLHAQITSLAPYHPSLITKKNSAKLLAIKNYITTKINLIPSQIHILFSENKGLDIGGFFLMLDQLFTNPIKFDYIVKIHTKTNHLRNLSLQILDCDLNTLLSQYDAAYSCPHHFNFDKAERTSHIGKHWHTHNVAQLKKLLNQYKLPERNFFFAGGTMFIASSQFINFFRDYNRLAIFESLNPGYAGIDGLLEHAYERFFGYLFEYLNLRTLHLQKYPYCTFNN